MADTLLAVAQEELQKANDEQKRAQGELAQAQTELADAEKNLADATDELSKLQDKAIEIRRKIAQTTIAADGKKLFDDLDANTSKRRAQQAAIGTAQETIASSRSRITGAQEELARSAAAAQASTDAAAAVKKSEDDHTAWAAKATAAPLSGLPGKADVSAGTTKTAADAATARLDGAKGGDLPTELFTRASERRQQRLGRLTTLEASARLAEDRLATEAAKGGLTGTSAKTKLTFERSEDALRTYVLSAQERFDRALQLLDGVKNSTPLNADEAARIHDLLQVAVAANVFALEKARDVAQAALDTQRDVVAAAIIDALAKKPSAKPSDDATVQTEQGKLPALEQAVTTKNSAYTAQKGKLDALEAAVPDATWALFDDYEEALAILADLANDNPTTLASTLATDEDAYAKALRAEQDNARTVVAVGEVARERDDRAATAAQSRPARLLEALRGDD